MLLGYYNCSLYSVVNKLFVDVPGVSPECSSRLRKKFSSTARDRRVFEQLFLSLSKAPGWTHFDRDVFLDDVLDHNV